MKRDRMEQGDCRRWGEFISAYLDDELTAVELLGLAEHLKECPRCSREMDELMAVKNLLHQAEPFWPKESPGERFLPYLLEKIGDEASGLALPHGGAKRSVWRIPTGLVPLAAAAALALVLMGAAALFFRHSQTLVAYRKGEAPAPAGTFQVARKEGGDDVEEYLRAHALESSRNLLMDDEYAIALVDHDQP